MSGAMKKDFRRDIQLVFQDAISAANPAKRCATFLPNRCAICSA
jgi:ABC-type dipeptide/oligopeptide/nickel transport system ATPase subunit